VKIFNPNIGKLDLKTVNCHFIDYLERAYVMETNVAVET